jgi:hypothetical protein
VFQLEPNRAFWAALADQDGRGVWLVGAGREVVHFDGQTQTPYTAEGIRGSLTALLRDGQGRIWIVGPETLFRAATGT